MELLIDAAFGIYIPQVFAETYSPKDFGLDDDEGFEILQAGPEQKLYWNVWEEIYCQARKGEQRLYHHPSGLMLATREEIREHIRASYSSCHLTA